MRGSSVVWVGALGLGLFGASLAVGPGSARACGGLFCNSSQPVNQAAERIIFVENGDGTVTAVIEIQYEGPSESFSWVLPVPGIPEVAVSSTSAFDRLQAATNPSYMLQTRFEEGCLVPRSPGVPIGAPTSGVDGSSGETPPPVTVVAAGTVGPFDYEVIMLNPNLAEPADAAIDWLGTNGYDVTALGPEVLGPYLENGLNLLAFRLNKQNDSGSIRPVVLSYESELPFIPIRPTAVAANDDMGVMVWVVGSARAVPDNYKALELNEARINWYNPMSNYNDVVSAAADEASGQGFVTELAAASNTLEGVVFQDFESQQADRILNQMYPDPVALLIEASNYFGQWDGFQDALRASVMLPPEVALEDFVRCPRCYANNTGVVFDEAKFRLELYEQVVAPLIDTQELLLSRPYVTRLYTTMSADEMTLDPAFNFNPDLPDVSNLHTAEQIIDCDGGFRVVLADGETVHGETQGVWPTETEDLPATRKILQLATQGNGMVVVDNSDKISELLQAIAPPNGGSGGRSGSGSAGRSGGSGGSGTAGEGPITPGGGDDCHCSTTLGAARSGRSSNAVLLALLALGWFVIRRRR